MSNQIRLIPRWVPWPFNTPGSRLKQYALDLYSSGAHCDGIDERQLVCIAKPLERTRHRARRS
jgi:hypothetical protein